MSEILILNYDNFENSLLSKEFDKKGGMISFSEYVTKSCNCICKFNDTDNQENMLDDSWTFIFKDKASLSVFCTKYNFFVENNTFIKTHSSTNTKKKTV